MIRSLTTVALGAALMGCVPGSPAVTLSEEEIDWCRNNVEAVLDAYGRSGAPALEGQDNEVWFVVLITIQDAELIPGSASPPPITAEQRGAIFAGCRAAFDSAGT